MIQKMIMPTFAKADVSIGVHSNRRLHPRLDCQYIVEFDRLALFLKRLSHENFEFSEICSIDTDYFLLYLEHFNLM